MTSLEFLERSPLWDMIHEGPLGDPGAIDLETFRSGEALYSISLWDPSRNGLRYLKTLLYNLLISADEADIDLYQKIPNRMLGKPITVRVRGVQICMDYYQAVDEFKTMAAAGLPRKNSRILEIGPGYGRTCHTIVSLCPYVSEYWLMDLPPCLNLSRRYLEKVLDPSQFAKLRFVPVSEFQSHVADLRFNLAINIDSLADLPPDVASAYLTLIDAHCDAFYCKNPVGKYFDPVLASTPTVSERVQLAFQCGLARDVIEIFDSEAVAAAVSKYLSVYRPGPNWNVAIERSALPWSYYHQVVYRRDSGSR